MDDFITFNQPTDVDGTGEHYVKAYFNYVAKDYNRDINELQIPCIYAEYEFHTDLGPVNNRDIPISDIVFSNRFFGDSPSYASPRSLFIYGSPISNSSESFFSYIDSALYGSKLRHICLFSQHRNPSNSAIRSTTGTDENAGLFPQAIKIGMNGSKVSDRTPYSLRIGLIRFKVFNSFCLDSIIKFVNNGSTEIKIDASGYESEADENQSENGYFYNTDFYYNQHHDDNVVIQEGFAGSFMDGSSNGIYGGVEDEPLFYQIDKEEDGQVIQTFWTSVLEQDGTGWEIVDTQVLPEYSYTYRCYVWKLKKDHTNSSGETGVFVVRQEANVFQKTVEIHQPPQPTPEIKFSLNGDIVDKYRVMLTLNLNRNSENNDFLSFSDVEKENFNHRRNRFNEYGEKKNFVYESESCKFEIYKMSERPYKTGGNIEDNYRAIPSLSNEVMEVTGSGVSVSTSLSLAPFPQKHYFVFRAINSYGYPSNPTPIYEVYLTEDADEVFLNFDSVEFLDPEVDKYKLNKTMMKLMQVIPSTNQLVLDESLVEFEQAELGGEELLNTNGQQLLGYTDANGEIIETGYLDNDEQIYLDNVTQEEIDASGPLFQPSFIVNSLEGVKLPNLGLNTEENSIWTVRDEHDNDLNKGKKFKIRVTSKDTGRKLDLNVKFILKKN